MSPPTHLSQFEVREEHTGYWRATFNNPPLNLMNAETAQQLQELVSRIEQADDLRVIVFDSAHPDFFFSRYDLSGGPLPTEPGPTGLPIFFDLTVRLSRAPVVSIACIQGRARGGGSEFALACDLRFAGRESALLGQPEVGVGMVPAGGGIERLTLLSGRARTLEIVLGADDFDADTAERYGWINRALPDAELPGYVDALAVRIASFDRPTLAAAKALVNRTGLPATEQLTESLGVAADLLSSPAFADRFTLVRAKAAAVGHDFELRMGHHIGTAGDRAPATSSGD